MKWLARGIMLDGLAYLTFLFAFLMNKIDLVSVAEIFYSITGLALFVGLGLKFGWAWNYIKKN